MTQGTKTSKAFSSNYTLLNTAQKKAVDTIEGPVMVIAGPGTGKTTILTLRIANILRRTDTPADAILALTFTESGVHAMRRKLTDIIGAAAYRVNLYTFHGFAEKIIQQYPDYFPRIIGSKIITDSEQIRIVEKIIRSSRSLKLLRPYGDPNYYVKPVLNEIHILKRENVCPSRLAESLKKVEAKNKELVSVYRQYEEALARGKFYDFEDMLLELIRAIENNPEFKLILQEAYQYILADEHQDANSAQNRILELLADYHESPNLFIVGDEKQAIYRFQGASLENFLYFTKKYPQAEVIDLEHNYRSHQLILDGSHSLIMNNPGIPGRPRRPLKSLQIGGRPIRIVELPTKDEELDYLAKLVKELIGDKREKPEQIAILYRENSHAGAISAALRSYGVQHRIESDRDILEEVDSVKIVTLCKAINDPSDSQSLAASLLLEEMGCDPADVAELCNRANREKRPLHLVIKGETLDYRDIFEAYNKIVAWSYEARTLAFHDFLQKLIQDTDLISGIVRATDSVERLESLEAFHNRVMNAAKTKKTFYLRDFIEYIETAREHGILAKRNNAEHLGGVRLMTAHRAKGLEFNYVFIVHGVDGIWGNRKRRNHFTIPIIEHARDAGRIEDERRLFYVAMTRAREGVIITSSSSDGDRETVRSQFLSEIDPDKTSDAKPVLADYHDLLSRRFRKPPKPLDARAGTILDPSFIKSKFLGQPLSVTHLNNYLECPWKYFFVNLIRIPQTETKSQLYGTAIHQTLRTFFESYKDRRDMSRKQLLDLFAHNLKRLPMSGDDRADSMKKGRRALGGYLDTYKGSWPRSLITEYSVKGLYGKLTLAGKLDKVEILEAGANVVDFKTGKPKSRNDLEGRTKSGDGNYKRQLAFYKVLLDGAGRLTMLWGEIDFIEPNDAGKYKREKFEIGAADVAEVKKLISQMMKDVTSVSFLDKGCSSCEYCRLGKIMLSQSAD